MLAAMTMNVMTSCGGDDGGNSNNDNSGQSGKTAQEQELVRQATGTWKCVMSSDKTSGGQSYTGLLKGTKLNIHSDGNFTTDSPNLGYAGQYTVKDNTITATSVSGTFSMIVSVIGDYMAWDGKDSNGTKFLYAFMREYSNNYISTSKIKEYLESESEVWELTEQENGVANNFYFVFRNGMTSGYTVSKPDNTTVNLKASYNIENNYITSTQNDVLKGGIYVQEITATTFKGYWCGGIPLTGKKITIPEKQKDPFEGTWTGYIDTYYYNRWHKRGDTYRTSIYFERSNPYGGRGYELDYNVASSYADYYCEFSWEVINGRIHIKYDDSWGEVIIYDYTLTDTYFDGFMDDGTTRDIHFRLNYDANFDWAGWRNTWRR